MANANDKAGAKPMPVTGSGCGIRPSKEAMEVEFGVDFSDAKKLLDLTQHQDTATKTNSSDSKS